MEKIQKIVQQLNKFDWGYEMSDSNEVFDRGQVKKGEIKLLLEELTDNQLNLVYKDLSDIGHKNLERYFKGYLPKLELLSNCCGASSKGGEDYGICPECGEHCEFINEQE